MSFCSLCLLLLADCVVVLALVLVFCSCIGFHLVYNYVLVSLLSLGNLWYVIFGFGLYFVCTAGQSIRSLTMAPRRQARKAAKKAGKRKATKKAAGKKRQAKKAPKKAAKKATKKRSAKKAAAPAAQ